MSEWNYNDAIADVLARTLDERRQLLKIMSMNHYDLEEKMQKVCRKPLQRAVQISMRQLSRAIRQRLQVNPGQGRFLLPIFQERVIQRPQLKR